MITGDGKSKVCRVGRQATGPRTADIAVEVRGLSVAELFRAQREASLCSIQLIG